jgi:plasmid stabilization system protein ParE
LKRVDVTDRALVDLLGITDFLSNYSGKSAERFIRQFEHALDLLRQFPESGRPANFNGIAQRVLHYFIYEVLPDAVALRRIIDGRSLIERP